MLCGVSGCPESHRSRRATARTTTSLSHAAIREKKNQRAIAAHVFLDALYCFKISCHVFFPIPNLFRILFRILFRNLFRNYKNVRKHRISCDSLILKRKRINSFSFYGSVSEPQDILCFLTVWKFRNRFLNRIRNKFGMHSICIQFARKIKMV